MSSDAEPVVTLAAASVVALAIFKVTDAAIPRLAPDFVAKGLFGYDQLKGHGQPGQPTRVPVPEATGVIGAGVYILLLSCFVPVPYLSHLVRKDQVDPSSITFPHHSLTSYLASLLSLLIATSLGFMDDLFDIRWRFKLPIPIIASVPLLVVYIAGNGVTDVVLPDLLGLRHLLGVEHTSGVLALGPLYYIYMSMLSTFCTNSINILAGINGVEAGQTLVIALSLVINDLLFIDLNLSSMGLLDQTGFGFARGSPELRDRHLFSLYFMLPLVGVCLALLKHNWFPARSFVGDTFCYFAGMTFAVVGILGHFSKTLLLFFLPQVFNFLLSTPQLFGLVPCPRHRLPKLNAQTGLLEPSFTIHEKPPSEMASIALSTFALLGLVQLKRNKERQIMASSNLTIINAVLVLFGPMKEPTLTTVIMAIQAASSVLAFAIRYGGASWFYGPGSQRQ